MMHDCDNGAVRDLLPEYLHDGLDAETRGLVAAHLAQCAVCTGELKFLRQAQGAFPTPAVDVAAIVDAVGRPVAPVRAVSPVRSSRWRVARWQIAAGVSFLLVGTLSLRLLRRPYAPDADVPRDGVSSIVPAVAPSATDPVTGAAAETLAAGHAKSRAPSEGSSAWSDLTDDQLQQLLDAIDGAEAVPGIEPHARTAPIMTPDGHTGRIGGTQ